LRSALTMTPLWSPRQPACTTAKRRGVLIDEQEGNAVGHEDGDGELVAEVDDDVTGAVRRCFVGGDDVGAVVLVHDDQSRRIDVMASATRRRFSFTCSGSSSTWSPRLSDSYGRRSRRRSGP
jgi:hypothetical protein